MISAVVITSVAILDAARLARFFQLKHPARDIESAFPMTCLRCYTTSSPRTRERASNSAANVVLVFSVGLMFAILEGLRQCDQINASCIAVAALVAVEPYLAFQLWRVRHRRLVCGACGDRDILPTDTPRAQLLRLRVWVRRRTTAASAGRALQ